MTSLKINNQTYDLLKQEFRSNGNGASNGNGYHHHEHDHEAHWLDDDFMAVEDTQSVMEGAVRQILEAIGEDPERQGLQRTPLRVAKAYAELTSGYHVDSEALINDAVFDVDYDEMVLVKDIDFYSMCEHHMLPFYGKAHVAYIPNGKVIGLSKIPRIVEMFARRLQVQERMTQQIADFLQETLGAQGVAVVVEGQHMCAAMRGVKKANARMTTSAMLGSFKHSPQTRGEFLDHVGRHGNR
jgi:GTP cyclohydrolase I